MQMRIRASSAPNGAGLAPESTTSGFNGYVLGSSSYSLSTAPNGEDAFASFTTVNGAQRTYNGGIFALTFSGADLNAINWQNANVQAVYGDDNQLIEATYAVDASPTPEPPTIVAVASGVFMMLGAVALRRNDRVEGSVS